MYTMENVYVAYAIRIWRTIVFVGVVQTYAEKNKKTKCFSKNDIESKRRIFFAHKCYLLVNSC